MDCVKSKAALYIRVSTEEQALEGQSVDAQIETLTQYCRLYDIDVYGIYKDLGVSGKSYKNRPGLQQLLKDASLGRFNLVLVWKISRLSRSLKDLLLILDQLERNGVVFTSYSEKFDTSTPVGRMTLQLLGSIAEFERNTIIDNVKLGLSEYARKGGKTGTILGYDGIEGRLNINKNEAEIVKLIYKLYTVNRMSMNEIAIFLNKRGLKTKRGKEFKKDGIAVILGNPAYIGINRHNVGSKDEFQTPGSHLPIIEVAQWKLAQSIMQENKHKRPVRKDQPSFLLSGKLICDCCGSPMNGFSAKASEKAYRYYRCKICGRLVAADKVEKKAIAALQILLLDPQIAKDTLCRLKKTSCEKDELIAQQIKNQLQAYCSQLDKYVSLLMIEDFKESPVIIERIKNTEEAINRLNKSLMPMALENDSKQIVMSESDYHEIIDIILKDRKSTKALVDSTVRRVKPNPDNDKVSLLLAFSPQKDDNNNFDL